MVKSSNTTNHRRAIPKADATLIALGAALVACDALMSACPDNDEQYERLYSHDLALREQINRISATTIKGLRAKARAAEVSLKGDEDCECVGAGSFVALCKSINRDIFSMAAA
jgi:hypothetical protein